MSNSALIIGAGPAGLMAAERLLAQGAQVQIFDEKPSIGRKFPVSYTHLTLPTKA